MKKETIIFEVSLYEENLEGGFDLENFNNWNRTIKIKIENFVDPFNSRKNGLENLSNAINENLLINNWNDYPEIIRLVGAIRLQMKNNEIFGGLIRIKKK
ncbi:hypothetical protein [Candidatus Hepatoplasma crinochetorum]|jgi:hypothetical protein|uniref:hypothetical protein n=1 Tax=Candidatus Hepatoplasma crinochetorum TaxID=295596 RepID=UPI003093260F|nr:MAG: hypothetical protein HCTKY_2740 [Candidatus Hepatoplasma crinochetorum]